MLVLNTNNFELDSLVPRGYRQLDSNIVLGNTRYEHGYIYGNNVGSALMPLLFNDIQYTTKTIVKSGIGEGVNNADIVRKLNEIYEQTNDQELVYVRVFVDRDAFDALFNLIDKDIFTNVSDAVASLYNKCLDQTLARTGITSPHYVKALKSRTKHIIVCINTWKDRDQESDFYLTLGLIPVLFEDYKSRFNEKEIDYFKTLVNRSQVKRISNVKANESFKEMISTEKYTKKFNKIKMESVIIQLVNGRINEAENKTQDALRSAENYLSEYHKMKQQYYEAQDFLERVRNNRDDAISEFNEALNMSNIIQVDISNNILEIFIKTYADFFNQDEAELFINNRCTGWLKQFFTDIFIEQKYKLAILTKFRFDYRFNNLAFSKPGSLAFDLLMNKNAMFNPHIQFYSCLGDYLPQIADAHAKKDLLLFNNLAIASTRSINFRDGTVMNRWIDCLLNHHTDYYIDLWNIKCIEDEDHNMHSIRDLYMNQPQEVELHDAGEEPRF